MVFFIVLLWHSPVLQVFVDGDKRKSGTINNVFGILHISSFPQNESVIESHTTSFICWTLTPILLYVKSIVCRQQSRSKTCFVSCLKPGGQNPISSPTLCPAWRKSVCSFLTNILPLKI